MALTYPNVVLSGGILLLDYNTQVVPLDLNLVATTAAGATTALKAIATAYADGVGGATIQSIRVTERSEPVEDDGVGVLNPVPAFGHEGQRLARFQFYKDGGGYVSIDVPATVEGILLADKVTINTAHAKVAALITALLTHGAGPNSEALTSLKAAFIKHKESKRG